MNIIDTMTHMNLITVIIQGLSQEKIMLTKLVHILTLCGWHTTYIMSSQTKCGVLILHAWYVTCTIRIMTIFVVNVSCTSSKRANTKVPTKKSSVYIFNRYVGSSLVIIMG